VAGTVSAQQSGAWTVGISGTHSVNLNNVSLAQTGGLPNVLLVRAVDDPARQPFQQQPILDFADGAFAGAYNGQPFSVPAGKRLVLEYIGATVSVPTGNRFSFQISTLFNNTLTGHNIMSTGAMTISGSDQVSINQTLHIYADGPSSVFLGGTRTYATGVLHVPVLLSGHLVDVP
jgi:hypothetical protein